MKIYCIKEGFSYSSDYAVRKAFTTKTKATNYLQKTLDLRLNKTYNYWEIKQNQPEHIDDGRWWNIKELEVVE